MSALQEIFVLYHSSDNLPADGQSVGWVDTFMEFLGDRVKELSGHQPKVTFVSERDRMPDAPASGKSALIGIISDQFASSTLLDSFVRLGDALRNQVQDATIHANLVFEVLKGEVSKKKHRAKLHAFEGYFFYHNDQETGEPRLYDHSNELRVNYFIRIEDLAFDLIAIGEEGIAQQDRRYVYLAYTGEDLAEERNIIKRELLRYGYKVLPTCPLLNDKSSLQSIVPQILDQCIMAIHMIGGDYGDEAYGGKSIPEIQNELAAEHNASKPIPRVIWFSPEMNVTDNRQQQFIDHLRQDAAAIRGAEMYQFPIEHLKSVIHEKLNAISVGVTDIEQTQSAAHGEDGNLIYVIFELRNADKSQQLIDHLEKEGFNVLKTTFMDDQFKMRSLHQNNLVKCDAVLIHYHDASPVWLSMKLQDIRKSAGFGRQGEFAVRGLLFTGQQPDIQNIRIEDDYQIMTDNGDLNSSDLSKFVASLKKMKENKANG